MIGSLDSEVLQVLCAPDPAIRVSDVVILDPSDPRSVSAGAIVLGIGTGGSERDTLALVERAARSGAAAVVFRTPGELPRGALDLGVAVLCVPPVMPWGQVYSLLRTALASAGAPGEADAAGVPLGDLFALADAVAASVGGPVTIEDPQFRVLAFSNLGHEIDEARRQTILGRVQLSLGGWALKVVQRRLGGGQRRLRRLDGQVVRAELFLRSTGSPIRLALGDGGLQG